MSIIGMMNKFRLVIIIIIYASVGSSYDNNVSHPFIISGRAKSVAVNILGNESDLSKELQRNFVDDLFQENDSLNLTDVVTNFVINYTS